MRIRLSGYQGRPLGTGDISTIPDHLRYANNAKPGEVRNPWGRRGKPKDPKQVRLEKKQEKRAMEARKLNELCRLEADEIMTELRRMYKDPVTADTVKVKIMEMIMDRGFGKATQTQVNAQVNTDGKTSQIDDAELNRRISETLDAVERVKNTASREAAEITGTNGPADLRKFN